MTIKNRSLATLVGFVVFFLLGWLVYVMLLMDFYTNNAGSATGVMRAEDEMIWWALILGNLFQTYLLVYIFGNWANITTFSDGLKAGAIIGLIMGLAFNLSMYGYSNIQNMTSALVDPIVSAVIMAITGGAIGFMLGRK